MKINEECFHKGMLMFAPVGIATPVKGYINELVVEAACISILNDGDTVTLGYGQIFMLNFAPKSK